MAERDLYLHQKVYSLYRELGVQLLHNERSRPMSTIPSVSTQTFDEDVLAAEGTTLVEFWAEWCGPCRAVTPMLEEIAKAHPDFRIVKINP